MSLSSKFFRQIFFSVIFYYYCVCIVIVIAKRIMKAQNVPILKRVKGQDLGKQVDGGYKAFLERRKNKLTVFTVLDRSFNQYSKKY